MNAIINRSTLKVVGVNRSPQANEFEVYNVEDLRKDIIVPAKESKKDVDGNVLYRLHQPDKEVITLTPKIIEQTDVTTEPVMVKQTNKIPLLDANGNQVTYQPTTIGETVEVTDEPVMITVENADGTTSEVQKKDDAGNLLYWGQVPTGSPIACFTTEEVEVQKVDSAGAKLYFKEISEDVITFEPQPDLEIAESDPAWTEVLEVIEIDVEVTENIALSQAPEHFTYQEIQPSLETLKKIRLTELYNDYQREKLGKVATSLLGADGKNIVFPYEEKNQNDYRSIGITFALDANQTESIIGSDSHGKFYISRADFMTLTKEFQNHEVNLYMKIKQKETEVLAETCNTVELVQAVKW